MNIGKLERDLLKILKSTQNDDRFYVLLDMINGTYKYEIDYINDLKRNKVVKSLEKIIIIGSDFEDCDMIQSMFSFLENIDSVNYQTISKNKFKYLRYSLRGKLLKATRLVISSVNFILIVLLLFELMAKKKDNPVIEPDRNDYSNSIGLSNIPDFNLINTDKFPKNVFFESSQQKQEEFLKQYTVNFILNKYGLTKEQFDILCAIVLSEAAPNSYEDAYAVINTIYNRTHSKMWVKIINGVYEGCGQNLYYQATFPRQFVVYEEEKYKEKMGVTNVVGYQAIIQFLVSEEPMHNYLSFRSNKTVVEDSERFTEIGNNYFEVLLEEDRIEEIQTKSM